MGSIRRWAINHNASILGAVFILGWYGYVYLSQQSISTASQSQRQRDILADTREVIAGELYDTAFSKREAFQPARYSRTNEAGSVEYDFDAISRALALRGYQSIPSSLSNKVDAIDALIDAGRIQGLQMAREILDEIERQRR